MKLETLKEKKPALSKTAWKKLLSSWAKTYHSLRTLRDSERLSSVLQATAAIKEWKSILEPSFTKPSFEALEKQTNKFVESLEEATIQQSFCELFLELAHKGKRSDLKTKMDHVLSELRTNRDHHMRRTIKLMSEFNARKAVVQLFSDFEPEKFLDTVSFGKNLDVKRDKLFNRLVEVIRSGRREDLGGLRIEVERFCHILEIAVAGGFEKGKKLRQTLRVLGVFLTAAQNEERFRSYLQALEEERYRDQNKVADVIWLRELRNHLGLRQAQTLQGFHSHIPLSLQVLKRKLSWK